jgi:hypothetical protein
MTNPYRQPPKPAFDPLKAKGDIYDALSHPTFNWRTPAALARAAGISESDVVALIEDMPEVRRSHGSKEVYGLRDRIGG